MKKREKKHWDVREKQAPPIRSEQRRVGKEAGSAAEHVIEGRRLKGSKEARWYSEKGETSKEENQVEDRYLAWGKKEKKETGEHVRSKL